MINYILKNCVVAPWTFCFAPISSTISC